MVKRGILEINRERLRYLERPGPGSTIVFLPGLGSNYLKWRAVWPSLPADCRLIGLELPAFSQVKDLARFTPFLKAALDQLGVEKVILVGHSLGGLVALHLAVAFPERVTKLVLVSVTLPDRQHPTVAHRLLLREGLNQRVTKAWLSLRKRQRFNALVQRILHINLRKQMDCGLAECVIDICSHDWKPDVKRLRCPVLCLYGQKDQWSKAIQGSQLYHLIKGAHLVMVKSGNHYLHHEKPELVGQLISRFLTD